MSSPANSRTFSLQTLPTSVPANARRAPESRRPPTEESLSTADALPTSDLLPTTDDQPTTDTMPTANTVSTPDARPCQDPCRLETSSTVERLRSGAAAGTPRRLDRSRARIKFSLKVHRPHSVPFHFCLYFNFFGQFDVLHIVILVHSLSTKLS